VCAQDSSPDEDFAADFIGKLDDNRYGKFKIALDNNQMMEVKTLPLHLLKRSTSVLSSR